MPYGINHVTVVGAGTMGAAISGHLANAGVPVTLLDIVPPDDSLGCLQDIHWTDGSFGYFPAYTLGAVNGVQIFNALCRDHPDWETHFSMGEIAFMRDWLETNIWSKGRTLTSQELLKEATGEGTNPAHFLSYIRKRYLEEHV